MHDDDDYEAAELIRAAEWRRRLVDADPDDARSAAAATLLEHLADGISQLRGSALFTEYTALCNWLAESEGIADFAALADGYRRQIGFDHAPANAEVYLRALTELAKRVAAG